MHTATRFFDKKELIFISGYPQGNNFKKPTNKKDNKELVNENVRFPQVLLIGPNGEQLGVMSSREAQFKANELSLDLLCVAPNAQPPVCKILNYGKFRFDQQKRAKEAKKNQKIVEVKEVQLTPQIGVHDMETKARHATKFLSEGNKVKVGVRFRGRQMTHLDVGEETLNRFIELVSEIAVIEKPAVMEGRWMITILAPKKNK